MVGALSVPPGAALKSTPLNGAVPEVLCTHVALSVATVMSAVRVPELGVNGEPVGIVPPKE